MLNAKRTITAIAVCSSLFAGVSFADEPLGPEHEPTPEMRAQMHARMRQMRARILRERVGLSEARAAEVEAVFQQFHDQRRATKQRVRGARRQLKTLLRQDSNDAAAYEAALTELHANHKAMHALREQEIQAVRAKLSPKEQAKFVLAMGKMRRKMRRHVFGRHRNRGHRHQPR